MLDEIVEDYVGQLLYVEPGYGWGWDNVFHSGPSDVYKTTEAKLPNDFHLRLVSLFNFRGERIGGVGRIEQPGHKFDGWWVVFQPRVMGRFDLVDQVPTCDLWIGENKPTIGQNGLPGFASEPHWIGGSGDVRRV